MHWLCRLSHPSSSSAPSFDKASFCHNLRHRGKQCLSSLGGFFRLLFSEYFPGLNLVLISSIYRFSWYCFFWHLIFFLLLSSFFFLLLSSSYSLFFFLSFSPSPSSHIPPTPPSAPFQ